LANVHLSTPSLSVFPCWVADEDELSASESSRETRTVGIPGEEPFHPEGREHRLKVMYVAGREGRVRERSEWVRLRGGRVRRDGMEGIEREGMEEGSGRSRDDGSSSLSVVVVVVDWAEVKGARRSSRATTGSGHIIKAAST
jgi:hypothetical protein